MPFDHKEMFSQDRDKLSQEEIKAVNTISLADKLGKPPEEVDYDSEAPIYFGGHSESNPVSEWDQLKKQANPEGISTWGKDIVTVVSGEHEPVYNGGFWNELQERAGESFISGKTKAKQITASAWDIVPYWYRGTSLFLDQVTEPFPKATELLDEVRNNPFIQTMFQTPNRWVEESGELKETVDSEMRGIAKKYGVASQVVDDLTTTVVDTTMFLATMRLANVKIGATPSNASSAEMSKQMLSRLKSAGKIGLFRAVTSEAQSLEERANIFAVSALYMATPAASGVFESGRDVFVADLILNSAVTAPQILDLWARDDIDNYDKLMESVKMVVADIVFSSMTKTMRGNRLSPNWKPMADASRALTEKAKDNAKAGVAISELNDSISNLNKLNKAFSVPPKTGSEINRIQGEQVEFETRQSGAVKIDNERAQAESDIKEIELAVDKAMEAKPATEVKPTAEAKPQEARVIKSEDDVKSFIDERGFEYGGKTEGTVLDDGVVIPDSYLVRVPGGKTSQGIDFKQDGFAVVKGEDVNVKFQEYLDKQTPEQRKAVESGFKMDAQEIKEEGKTKLSQEQLKDIKDIINETKDVPADQRVDIINKTIQDAIDGKPPRTKTSPEKRAIEASTGVKAPKKMIVVDEYQMLKKQLRDINRGVKEGKKLGVAETKLAQQERDARLSELHVRAREYVDAITKNQAERRELKSYVKDIKTVDGLDKFQGKVNDALAKTANRQARADAKKALRSLSKTKLGGAEKLNADTLFEKFDARGTSDEKLTELAILRQAMDQSGVEFPQDIQKKMQNLSKVQLRNMTTEDLRSLEDIAKSIIHAQKAKENLTKQGQIKFVEQKANEFVSQQDNKTLAESGFVDADGNRIMSQHNVFKTALSMKRRYDLTPDALTFALDGGREGVLHDLYVDSIWRADNQRLKIEQEAHTQMEPYRDVIVDWGKSDAENGFRTTLAGNDVTLSIGEKINIYLDSLNQGNTRHALDGGYELEGFKGRILKPTQEEFDRIVDSVRSNPNELQVASIINQGYDRILKPAMNEASNKTYGYDIAKIENYNPINTVTKAGEAEISPASMLDIHQTLIDSSPHFKSRTGGRQPIRLKNAIDKYDQMVKLISRYNAYVEPIMYQKKFLDGVTSDGRTISSVLESTYGKQYVRGLEKLTKDLEVGGNRDTTEAMRTFNKGVLFTARGYLALNPSVAAGQPVSYLTARNVIPPKHWAKGNYLTSNVPWEEMSKYSSLMWSRGKGHLDIAFGESAEAKRMQKRYAMIRAQDHKAISMIVEAAKSWSFEELGRVDMKDVYSKVDDVVRRTQPTFETIDRPELARDPNFRVATVFSSVINKNHALKFKADIEALRKVQRGEFGYDDKKEYAKSVVLNRVVTPGVYSFIKTATSVGLMYDVFVNDESVVKSFGNRWLNKFFDAEIGEEGMIMAKLGNMLKLALSKVSDNVKGYEQQTPIIKEVSDLTADLISLGSMLLEEDSELFTPASQKKAKRDREKMERIITRSIRNSLSLTGTGAQNIMDWVMIPYEAITKDSDGEDQLFEK